MTTALAVALAPAAGAVTQPATVAAAAAQAGGAARSIVVVDVDGLLDPVTAELVERSISEAERDAVALVVVAIDSSVSVDVDVDRLARRVERATVPVVAWVKGGGAARGGAAQAATSAHLTALATDGVLEAGGVEYRGVGGPVDVVAPTLRDLVAVLDGLTVTVAGDAVTLGLGERVGDGQPTEKRVLPIRFRELDLTDQAQHALTSPFVAYLLLVLGACLVVFEFFAVGIGVAAAAGALLLLGAFVGFAHLPVNAVSLGLLLGGIVAIAVDVQAGRPRFWAVTGAAMLAAGSLRLYGGPSRLDPPVWQVLVVLAGALLFLLPGLAAVIRARFSTPTIGRDWMVGETGVAAAAFDPEGVVTVRGAPWRAHATRAARIEAGESVRVTAIRGLVLEVEPVESSGGRSGGDRAARGV